MSAAGSWADPSVENEDHPLWALHLIADRKLARLAPILTAIDAEAPTQVRPEQALKALLLMAFFDLGDRRRACVHLAAVPAFQRFLGDHRGAAAVGELDLAAALDRLLPRAVARGYVREVVAAADASGLSADHRFSLNAALVGEWTSQPGVA